jgi:hypothetical protein
MPTGDSYGHASRRHFHYGNDLRSDVSSGSAKACGSMALLIRWHGAAAKLPHYAAKEDKYRFAEVKKSHHAARP